MSHSKGAGMLLEQVVKAVPGILSCEERLW